MLVELRSANRDGIPRNPMVLIFLFVPQTTDVT
jgi:hypothetical protein